MDLEVYLAGPGASERGSILLRALVLGDGYGKWIDGGLWLFSKETAHNWSQPWPGGFAAWRLIDHAETIAPGWRGRPRKHRAGGTMPKMLTARGDEDEAKYGRHGNATSSRPFELHLSGSDDTAYVKSYTSLAEARAEIALFESGQPLDYQIVRDFGFYG